MSSTTIERMQLARDARHHCHARGENGEACCPEPATFYARDRTRDDAITFYCAHHAPRTAAEIEDDRAYLAVEIAVIVVVGGSTCRPDEAAKEAVRRVESVLAREHIKVEVLGTSAGLLAPRRAFVPNGLQRATGGR